MFRCPQPGAGYLRKPLFTKDVARNEHCAHQRVITVVTLPLGALFAASEGTAGIKAQQCFQRGRSTW
jgi:hypothetical protein